MIWSKKVYNRKLKDLRKKLCNKKLVNKIIRGISKSERTILFSRY